MNISIVSQSENFEIRFISAEVFDPNKFSAIQGQVVLALRANNPEVIGTDTTYRLLIDRIQFPKFLATDIPGWPFATKTKWEGDMLNVKWTYFVAPRFGFDLQFPDGDKEGLVTGLIKFQDSSVEYLKENFEVDIGKSSVTFCPCPGQ